ncbi:major facilitator superfamily domain-containing protein [Dendryphion nanum]|uniref:Major facilitator superfamily domain-containing protein n=1 Tax=Dendryphion nanum TaxID=256645 RepID=A0A9P9DAA7_9PLEO|nr:major facilitator superfamily domain-containing protein [Dendryphion nanum]
MLPQKLENDIEKSIVPPRMSEDVATMENIDTTSCIDPMLEKRVRRKLDTRLVPLTMALYLLAFLDRSNIGNARIAGFSTDLSLTPDNYDWLLTMFYISYILFQPLSIMWKVLPPHRWAAFCVLSWGLVSSAQAGIHTWGAAMALRFLMGIFEAGYGPGIPYLLSFFYLRNELGLRVGLFFSAAPLANTFAGALAYGITSGSPGIAKWRVLFLVEGLPTVVMAAAAWFFLPDSPETARFLNEEEKEVARARGVRQAGKGTRVGGANFKEILKGLSDPKGWILGLMYFSCNVAFSSISVFLPTILLEMGFSSVNAQGLTAPPFFLSFIVTILTPYIADRTEQRGIMVAGLSIVGGIGYVVLATAKTVAGRYTAVFLVTAGIFPAIANILPWVLNNQGSDERRGAGIIILNLIGQCGPLLGTRLYPSRDGPYYVKGQAVCAAFMFFVATLAMLLRYILSWENRKLDNKSGRLDTQTRENERTITERNKGESRKEGEEKEVAVENYGPAFRYVL